MGKQSKAKARKKQQTKSNKQMKKGHKIAQEQINKGGIPSMFFESNEKDCHFSIISMSDCVKVNAYGDMNNPEWIKILENLGLKENGTITDSSSFCDCPVCHGSGLVNNTNN